MKKPAKSLLLLLGVTIVIFFSCKKESIRSEANDPMIASVNTWLAKQQNPLKPHRSNNIQTLQSHLNFSAMQEIQHDRGNLVVIPIDNEFRTLAKISDESILNLVALLNKDGSIRDIKVAVYTAPKGLHVAQLPATTFNNIYHTAKDVTDGQYRFLSPAGTKLYQLEYKNGRMASEGHIKKDPKNGNVQTDGVRVNVITCTPWVLETTFFGEDGEVTAIITTPVGSYCEGCDNEMFESFCGFQEYGGGGDTGGGSPVYTYATVKRFSWIVSNVNDTARFYAIDEFTSEERQYITKVTPEGEVWVHKPTQATMAGAGSATWNSTYVATAVTSWTGTLTYDFSPTFHDPVHASMAWSIADVR